MYRVNISAKLPVSLAEFWWRSRTPNLNGEEEAVGGRGWYRSTSKERWRVPIGPPYYIFCSIFTRFKDIAAFVFQHATFPHPTCSLPKISSCSRGNCWIAFGLRRAKVSR